MAEVEDRDNTTHQTRMNNLPRDLLKRFIASSHRRHHRFPLPLPAVKSDHAVAEEGGEEKEKETEEDELELSLGLSMNGRFGVDPTAKKIKRTTSIPELVNQVRDEEMGYMVPVAATGGLIRTCSLPTESEEQWRKRKELQTMRRMEARKKRSEKQRNLKAMRERNIRGLSEEVVGLEEHGGGGGSGGGDGGGLRRTTSLTSRVGGLGLNCEKEKGASSSESDGQHGGQGTTPMDTTSPIGTSLLPDESKSPATSGAGAGARVTENSGKTAAVTMRSLPSQHSAPQNRTKDMVRNLLEDMPSVSTKGEGPNGKKIEGFLYRYGKGEEVRILCVCHGSFLTPAEFVKHAGGTDVANPLKHIVVSPSFL